jgi:hypothetical protein
MGARTAQDAMSDRTRRPPIIDALGSGNWAALDVWACGAHILIFQPVVITIITSRNLGYPLKYGNRAF